MERDHRPRADSPQLQPFPPLTPLRPAPSLHAQRELAHVLPHRVQVSVVPGQALAEQLGPCEASANGTDLTANHPELGAR